MIEEDLEKSDERLRLTTQKLEEAHQAADESERFVLGCWSIRFGLLTKQKYDGFY